MLFGMGSAHVRSAMGDPRPGATADYLSFNVGVTGVFLHDHLVEITVDPGPELVAVYRGLSILDTPADAMINHIALDASTPPVTSDPPDRATFYDLDLVLWRPMVPDDFASDAYENEYYSGERWMSITLGVAGYCRHMDAHGSLAEFPAQ